MDYFDDLLVPDAVSASVTVANKKQLFQKLGALAASAYALDANDVVERLIERERLGSTGFGGGIAIPHAKLDTIDQVRGAVVRLGTPIAFDSVDESPVDIAFMLLSPIDCGAEHLKTLARVSRFLRNETHVARMRGTRSDAALFALLAGGRAVTLPDAETQAGAVGEAAHFRALERLYASAAINRLFPSHLTIAEAGHAEIRLDVDERFFHAAGATHGTVYFKMLDDAAFYAANSLVNDRFLLTTGFNLFFTRPLPTGPIVAQGRWLSGKRRVHIAEARLLDAAGEEVGRGTGTFMRSAIPLAQLPGYALPSSP